MIGIDNARHFYDSTDPGVIPDRYRAALYGDGEFGAAGLAARRLFRHKRMITIADDWESCGIADYEPGNPVFETPGMLRRWKAKRVEAGLRGRTYLDRSNLASALSRLSGLPQLWWIAAWSGPAPLYIPGYDWRPEELAADILANEKVEIDPETIWAIQHEGGPGHLFDVSRLCLDW